MAITQPRTFHHPYQPYDIQLQFMVKLYECIEKGGVGIFESPTGTGKSLSLICASLTWLREHKRRQYDETLAAIKVEDDEPSWMTEHAQEAVKRDLRQAREELESRLAKAREREQNMRKRQQAEPTHFKRMKTRRSNDGLSDDSDNEYILDDYDSADETYRAVPNARRPYSEETNSLMEQIGILPKKTQQSADEVPEETKILFCSRTHSQLSQLVGELRRVKLPPGLPADDTVEEDFESLKHLSLGSRKNLCINPKVNKLGDVSSINERCLELQQTSTSAERKCPYLPNRDDQANLLDFRDYALAKVRDIEDLSQLGAQLKLCPYYASRSALAPAEAVTLPYPLLLQKTARDAIGLSLKGHIVIIDEAHNILDAIEGLHLSQVSNAQLQNARSSLLTYLQKFRNRLKGANRVYLAQVIKVIDSLLKFMAETCSDSIEGGRVEPGQLLQGKGVDQINLSKLVTYIDKSKLARKVEGYISAQAQTRKEESKREVARPATTPVLTLVQSFVTTLMNPAKEGCFFWSRIGDRIILRYTLLDPSEHFRDVVEEARAVVLAGGTMSPMSDYSMQLFPYLDNIATFSCGHLITPDQLLVRTITSDQHGPFDFSYKGRMGVSVPGRIAAILLQASAMVKGGMVVFFPSYGLLEQILQVWKKGPLLSEIEKTRSLFCDERGVDTEALFTKYQEAVRSHARGAIMLSVMGGKLSEGINFSDELGRCVIVIGLPFPNLETPEWKAKMNYVREKANSKGLTGPDKGSELAENACMRSVNQAIGRVIRHKDDWASILLVDNRYGQKRVTTKLPGWIRAALPDDESRQPHSAATLSSILPDLDLFFRRRSR